MSSSPSRTRLTRSEVVLVYQPAESGDPDVAPVRERTFSSEADARSWADRHFVVPLYLEAVEKLIGDNARVLGTVRELIEY